MKKIFLLLCLATVTSLWAHGGHGVEDVVNNKSFLWLKGELSLDGKQYKKLNKEIKEYLAKEHQTAHTSIYKDSLFIELQKEKPSQDHIEMWNEKIIEETKAGVEAFSKHMLRVKKILDPKQFSRFIEMSGHIYYVKEEKHRHSHEHKNGTFHTHAHDHEGNHKHDHPDHNHPHIHKDGTSHSHPHLHEGDHKHEHNQHMHSHKHQDGTTHSHKHDHEGDHSHKHATDSTHSHSHSHDGKEHSHKHGHDESHKHSHE